MAQRDLEHYRRNGPSASTRQLLSMTRQVGVADLTVLDIGGGIGTVAHELLESGAARATVVEASGPYLAAARAEAERRRTVARLDLISGDFVTLTMDLPVADVVTLDKVVCCYPDFASLLGAATDRARRLVAIVYPRDGWWVRVAIGLQNAVRALRRSAFRVYVFPNAAIDDVIRRAGFTLRTQQTGVVWVVALYDRSNTP